jgi:hypothetical protein
MKSSLTVLLDFNNISSYFIYGHPYHVVIVSVVSYLAFMVDVIWGALVKTSEGIAVTCDVPYRARRFKGRRDGDSVSQVKLDFFIYVVNSSTCYHWSITSYPR